MPQDAPPNGGARDGGPVGSWSRVAGMQAKLHRWAAADPGRRGGRSHREDRPPRRPHRDGHNGNRLPQADPPVVTGGAEVMDRLFPRRDTDA